MATSIRLLSRSRPRGSPDIGSRALTCLSFAPSSMTFSQVTVRENLGRTPTSFRGRRNLGHRNGPGGARARRKTAEPVRGTVSAAFGAAGSPACGPHAFRHIPVRHAAGNGGAVAGFTADARNPGHTDPLATLRGHGRIGRDGRSPGRAVRGTARFGPVKRGHDVGTEAQDPELCIVNQWVECLIWRRDRDSNPGNP